MEKMTDKTVNIIVNMGLVPIQSSSFKPPKTPNKMIASIWNARLE